VTEIEDLIARFDSIPAAQGGRWSVNSFHSERVYLSKDEVGSFTIFLRGDPESFGTYPKVRGVQFAENIVPIPGGIAFSALKLSSPNADYGNRAIAHVAYEIDRRLRGDPNASNASLVENVGWILGLLTSSDRLMSPEQQKGLIGELLLLRKLVTTALNAQLPAVEALHRWWGWDRAKRDFAAHGLAIEVKTTSLASRRHYIGSLDQLDPHGDESVYVFSLGARLDPTAPRKLPDVIAELRSLLDPEPLAVTLFDQAVEKYGYNPALESQYRSLPGVLNFHLPPKFFRVKDLDRLRATSFKGDRLPSMVSEVMYVLEITAPELHADEEEPLLRDLLSRSASSG
jgi:Putative  PD-(D/E)XK family member, (DUF4420)